MVPVAINALQTMSSAMNSIAAGALAHPEMAKAVGEGLIALSAGLAALGTAAIVGAALAFAPGGAIAIGILGIGASVAALAAMNWQGVATALQGLVAALKSFVSSLGGEIEGAIKGLQHDLGGSNSSPTGPGPGHPGGGGGKPLHTGLYSPAGGHHTTVIVYADMDGQKITNKVVARIARASEHPTSAPAFDTYGHYVDGGYAFSTG